MIVFRDLRTEKSLIVYYCCVQPNLKWSVVFRLKQCNVSCLEQRMRWAFMQFEHNMKLPHTKVRRSSHVHEPWRPRHLSFRMPDICHPQPGTLHLSLVHLLSVGRKLVQAFSHSAIFRTFKHGIKYTDDILPAETAGVSHEEIVGDSSVPGLLIGIKDYYLVPRIIASQ